MNVHVAYLTCCDYDMVRDGIDWMVVAPTRRQALRKLIEAYREGTYDPEMPCDTPWPAIDIHNSSGGMYWHVAELPI